MFVTNSSSLLNKIVCGKRLADRLINVYEIPLLSQEDDKYYFSKTKKLEDILSNMNWFEKWLFK